MQIKILKILAIFFFLCSCAQKEKEDPLVIPPQFSQLPDPKNPEKPANQSKEAEVEKLRQLLLKSDEY